MGARDFLVTVVQDPCPHAQAERVDFCSSKIIKQLNANYLSSWQVIIFGNETRTKCKDYLLLPLPKPTELQKYLAAADLHVRHSATCSSCGGLLTVDWWCWYCIPASHVMRAQAIQLMNETARLLGRERERECCCDASVQNVGLQKEQQLVD